VRQVFSPWPSRICGIGVAVKRERTFRLFESYDLDGNKQITLRAAFERIWNPRDHVTNARRGARSFERCSQRCASSCATEEEFQREARAVFSGIQNEIPFERPLEDCAAGRRPAFAGTRYRLLDALRRGMGVVYAAKQNLQRRWARKCSNIPGTDGDLASRLLRQARVLAVSIPASCRSQCGNTRDGRCSTP